MSGFRVCIPAERCRSHALRMRARWGITALAAAPVFAGSLVLHAAIDLALAPLFALTVVHLASGAGLIVGAWQWFRGRRADPSYEDLELVLADDLVHVTRGDVVVVDGARLERVVAFPDWIGLRVTDPKASFAIPIDGADRVRLLESVSRDRRVHAPSFFAWWAWTLVSITSIELFVLVAALVICIAVAAAVLAIPVVLGHFGGPLVGAIAFLVLLSILTIASLIRFARWARTTPGGATVRGVLVSLGLVSVHAVGWMVFLSAKSGEALNPDVFYGLLALGWLVGVPWGVMCGMMPLAKPKWPRVAFAALGAAPVALICIFAAVSGGASAALYVLPALVLAALGGFVLAHVARARTTL